jgi:ribose transport system ATP-binding protein
VIPPIPADAGRPPLLHMEGIDKSFPGVQALRGAGLDLHQGEVLALLGENGAGKSTLIKTLSGAHLPDAGTISIDGRPAHISTPREARRLGIAVIYQEFNLVPTLSASENIFLGREETVGPFISFAAERRRTREILHRMDVAIDPDAPVSDLTVAQQQVVEIARALSLDARIMVMDEPTAALTGQEVEHLFRIIAELKGRGLGVIYITHRLEEVFRIAGRATVLRDGRLVGTRPVPALGRRELIEMMVGRKLETEFPKEPAPLGEERLVVRGLSRGTKVRDVSFSVRRGEVLGLAGLVGAGRTEVARLIFGADRPDAGSMELDGRPLRIRSPRDAIRSGICLLTEDRKAQGLVLGLSVLENFALPSLKAFCRRGLIDRRKEMEAFARFAGLLRIKVPDCEEPAGNLSGGNQQKVVLGKWLQANSEVVIFDEPTRGIDVGAKYEIYQLMNRLARSGKAMVMISSELPEALGMSDRILVMHEGRVKGEITDVPRARQEDILAMALG